MTVKTAYNVVSRNCVLAADEGLQTAVQHTYTRQGLVGKGLTQELALVALLLLDSNLLNGYSPKRSLPEKGLAAPKPFGPQPVYGRPQVKRGNG